MDTGLGKGTKKGGERRKGGEEEGKNGGEKEKYETSGGFLEVRKGDSEEEEGGIPKLKINGANV